MKLLMINRTRTRLLIASMLITALTATNQVSADDAEEMESFQMAVVVNRAQGHRIVKGDYSTAVERLAQRQGFATQTNLCVSYTMMKEFDAARSPCETALQLVDEDLSRDTALAHSNLGVLKVLSGDSQAAREHFVEAASMPVSLVEAAHNLARLKLLSAS